MSMPTDTLTLSWSSPITRERLTRVVALPATIGRGAQASVQLASEQISREHARIAREEGQFVLTDSSQNGTRINGQRRKRGRVVEGDLIQVGPYQIEVRLGGEVERDGAPMPGEGARDSKAETVPVFDILERSRERRADRERDEQGRWRPPWQRRP